MLDIVKDTLLDVLKLLPYLFITFLIIELMEDRLSDKSEKILTGSRKFGPLFGSLLGLLPQCGFSVMASNLYTARIISAGTLIAIFLSTSDEMLPIMISNHARIGEIITILAVKLVVAVIFGFAIDLLLPKKDGLQFDNSLCQQDDCHCEEKGPVSAALKHTFNTALYILILTFLLNGAIELFSQEAISRILMQKSLFGPFVSSLIGLIPNCASSIILTQLYLSGGISFAMVISGLLTNCGVGLLVLYRNNRHLRENLLITLAIYLIGAAVGIIFMLIG